MITHMPSLREDDEAVATSQVAATSLKASLEETKAGADEEENEATPTFVPAQPRPSAGGKVSRTKPDTKLDDSDVPSSGDASDSSSVVQPTRQKEEKEDGPNYPQR